MFGVEVLSNKMCADKNKQVKYSEYQETLAPFYNGKVEAFLNKNLAKVD